MKNSIVFMAAWSIITLAAAQTPLNTGSALSASGGRFVFGQISDAKRDQYLLDTQTGRLWRSVCAIRDKNDASKCLLDAMASVDFLDGKGNFAGTSPSPSGK